MNSNEIKNGKEKITRAKVKLHDTNPFFSYLVINLKVKDRSDDVPSMGVNLLGELAYNEDFVMELTEGVMQGTLVHEIMHLVLDHLTRIGSRNRMLWNIAGDIVVNDMVVTNGLELPENTLIPENHSITVQGYTVKNIDKKSVYVIYDELYHNLDNKSMSKCSNCEQGSGKDGDGKSSGCPNGNGSKCRYKGFDEHGYGDDGSKDEKGRDLTESQIKEARDKWRSALAEAATYSRQQGTMPVGMDRVVDEILEGTVSWRHKLYKYITNDIPFDFTYRRPTKKSYSIGTYLPDTKKETLRCIVSIDSSGSIQQKELSEFLAEITSIAKSFHSIEMSLIVCDAGIHDVVDVKNGNLSKIRNMKVKGGGGTSHTPIVEWINKNEPNTKLYISLTDGYSDMEKCFPNLPRMCNKIVVLPEGGKNNLDIDAEVINLR